MPLPQSGAPAASLLARFKPCCKRTEGASPQFQECPFLLLLSWTQPHQVTEQHIKDKSLAGLEASEHWCKSIYETGQPSVESISKGDTRVSEFLPYSSQPGQAASASLSLAASWWIRNLRKKACVRKRCQCLL